jgi:hypothetical protein
MQPRVQSRLQSDINQKIQQAKQAGYSDAEINQYIAQTGLRPQPQAPSPQPQQQRGVGGVGGLALDLIPFGRVAEKSLTGKGSEIGGGELLFEALTALPIGRLAKAGKLGTTVAKGASKTGRAANIIGDTSKSGSAATRLGRQKIASTGLEEAITGTEAGRTLFTQDKVNQAAQTVFKRFSAKSPVGIKRELPKVRDLIFKQRDALLSDIPGSVTQRQVAQNIGEQLSKFGITVSDSRKVQEILKRNIPELASKKTFSAMDLSKIQRKLNASVKPSVFEGVAPNRSEDLILGFKEGIDDVINSFVPQTRLNTLRGFNKEISDLFIINKAGTVAGKGVAGVGPISLPKNILRRAQRSAAEQGERFIGRETTLPGALAQFGFAEAGSAIASQAAQNAAQLQQTEPTFAGDLTEQDMFSQLTGALGGQQQMQQQTQQPQSLLSQEDINQAILTDLQATGGKNIEQIQMIAQMYGPQAQGAQQFEEMTADQQKRIQNLNTVSAALDNLEREASESGIFREESQLTSTIRGPIERVVGSATDPRKRQYIASLRSRGIQIIRALGEVGNLSQSEQQAAAANLPTPGDNAETAFRKIQSLRELFGQIQENVVTPQLTGGFGR